MKTTLFELSQQALTLIKDPKVTDPATIAKLGPLPAKLQSLEQEFQDLEQETERISAFLNEVAASPVQGIPNNQDEEHNHPGASPAEGRKPQQKLRIEIDWPALGKGGEKQIICEYKASASLAKFVIQLHKVYGPGVLEKLSRVTVNRGPFVSKNPKSDYWNRSRGESYQYVTIPGTGCALLTTNSTPEKVLNIQRACRALGFPPTAVKVEAVDKFEEYEL